MYLCLFKLWVGNRFSRTYNDALMFGHFVFASGPVEGNDLNIEAVVRCIRSSDNPHTHQQALLVLAVAAKIVPVRMLFTVTFISVCQPVPFCDRHLII